MGAAAACGEAPEQVSADAGYGNERDLGEPEKRGINGYVALAREGRVPAKGRSVGGSRKGAHGRQAGDGAGCLALDIKQHHSRRHEEAINHPQPGTSELAKTSSTSIRASAAPWARQRRGSPPSRQWNLPTRPRPSRVPVTSSAAQAPEHLKRSMPKEPCACLERPAAVDGGMTTDSRFRRPVSGPLTPLVSFRHAPCGAGSWFRVGLPAGRCVPLDHRLPCAPPQGRRPKNRLRAHRGPPCRWPIRGR